jgi:uncharacterized LabA/DUF88 family protein
MVYIDGFNFYFGLRSEGYRHYYWLDFPKFARNLTRKLDNSEVVGVKYFTARINWPESKRKRQNDYLEALTLRGGLEIVYGNYRDNEVTCGACKHPNLVPNEKQTDVNIAVHMMEDAYDNKFDTLLLIGGDSDLVPPLVKIKTRYPEKHIRCCFPPRRSSKEIRAVSDKQLHIEEADYKNSLLPDVITHPTNGWTYRRPNKWK